MPARNLLRPPAHFLRRTRNIGEPFAPVPTSQRFKAGSNFSISFLKELQPKFFGAKIMLRRKSVSNFFFPALGSKRNGKNLS